MELKTRLAKKWRFYLTLASGALLSLAVPVYAQVPNEIGNGANTVKPSGSPSNLLDVFQKIINTVIFLIGAIAVVMLIIGGVRYVISAGNEAQVKGASHTIIYAVIGIIVAIVAYAVVNFVIGALQ